MSLSSNYILTACFQYRKSYFSLPKSFMNLDKSVSHNINSSHHFFLLLPVCFTLLQVKCRVQNIRSTGKFGKAAWLTKYDIVISTTAKIKTAIAPMNKSLVDDGVNSFQGPRKNCFSGHCALFPP